MEKLCVDIIGTYKIRRKGKYTLILKSVTMVDPVTRWSEITQYNNKKAMTIVRLAENTWLVRYPWPVEIKYDQGGESLSREFKNSLIEQ